jgi:hypothetical protein
VKGAKGGAGDAIAMLQSVPPPMSAGMTISKVEDVKRVWEMGKVVDDDDGDDCVGLTN